MKRHLYAVYSKEENKVVAYYEATSPTIVLRNNFRIFDKINAFWSQDWQICDYGELNNAGILVGISPHVYDSDEFPKLFKFPDVSAKPLDASEQEALKSQVSS